MRFKLQMVAECLLALGISAVMVSPCVAQRGRTSFAMQRPAPPKPKPQPQKQQQRQAPKQNSGGNRPAGGNANAAPRGNGNANRPQSAYTPPPRPQKNFNNLNPQEQKKILENNKRFQNLSPGQKQQMREAAQNWNRMTPEQRNHIQNDVIPKWKQLPPDRQRAIQQRLGVLKNMPESARNQHLDDPNFTRGMNDDDKAMLRDLSHMHVGGAPETPNE